MSNDRSTLLLADDDPTIADSLAPFLERAGFHVLVVSDGTNARIGTITSGRERFARWRTIQGEKEAATPAASKRRAMYCVAIGSRVLVWRSLREYAR